MKKSLMLILFTLILGLFASVYAQSIANYAFSTATNGSLVDMSSGTTTLLADATYHDDVASSVTGIGFTFPFAGTNYTQFSINSNGQMRLGSTVISGTSASIASGVALIAPMNGDNSTQSTGKVHYKLLTSPSNILVVEWKHLRINYSSGETGGTYCTMQALLYESGKIEFIYGQMNVSSTSSQSRTIFIAGSNVAGSVAEIRNITTTFDFVNTFAAISATSFPASTLITNLNSSSDGSRRVISFTPTTVPGVMLTSPLNNAQNQALQPTLTWTRWITPTHYLLYVGTDNPPTNFINGSNIGTVTSYVLPSALSNNTTYNWKVVPIYGDSQEGTSDQRSFKTLEAPLTGTKTIHPTTGDYTSFTAAFAALNVSGVGAGGVTFNVAPGLTFTESNMNLTATGTVDNPIVFQKNGEGANPIIYAGVGVGTGSTDYIVRLTGTDYLTWDGINLYENSSNTTSTTQVEYALWVTNAAATNGAQNNIFKNFKIVLNRTNTSTRAIQTTTPTTPTNQTTGNNNSNEFYNITIENTYVGMWLAGNSTTYFDSGTIIRYCTIGADAANDIGNGTSIARGIYMTAQQNVLIRNNVIRNISGTSTLYGMDLNSMVGSNNRIFNNKVYNITNTSTTSTSALYGINLSAFTTGTQDFRVYNNMLWNLNHGFTGTATVTYYVYGIYVASGGATNTYNIDFNSIRLSTPTNASNACVYFASNAGINKLRSNILANFTSGHATPYHLGIFSASATALGATGSVSNNNVIHIANSTGGYAVRGVSTNYATIAAWTTASSQDNNSRPGNPQFDDANYLYVRTDTPTPVESKGAYLGIDWVTLDIDGQSRHASTPDIGADEGTFQLEVIAETPTAQPTSLVTVPNSTSINGSFTAASPVAEKYLVVRSTAAHDTTPVDGTSYAPGGTLGNGTIVQASNGLTFSATGLTAATEYVFTIYSYNDTGIGAPKYLTTSPLTGTRSTLPTAPANPATFTATANNWQQINLAATANAGTDPIMVAWNTTSTFGTPATNVDYSSSPAITGGGTVMYIGAASGLPNHTGLNELTTYYYRAWSYLTSGEFKVYSTGTSSNATTTMAPLAPPHTQNFNTTTPAFPPAGWTRWSGQLANPTTLATSTTWVQDDWLNVSGTNKAARMNIWSTSMFHWFVSPRFDLPAGDYKLKFDMCLTDYGNAAAPDMNGDDDKFIVLVSDDLATWTPTNVVREWNNTGSTYVYNSIPYTGTSVMIPLMGISGTKYFAFYGESTVSNADNDFMVDNFQIAILESYPVAPATPSPALAATNVAPITNLGWVNDGTVTKIDVYFGADSTLVNTLDSSVRVVENQTNPLNSCNLPVLAFGTRYFWKVVAKNDADPVETATSPLWSFTTMADPTVALPWSEAFATTTWPANWVQNYTLSTTTGYGNPAPGAYKIISSPITVGYAQMPQVGPLGNIAVLEFDYKYTVSGATTPYTLTASDQTKIMVSTNYGDTFTQYAAINSSNHTTTGNWTRKRVILTDLGASAGDKIIVRLENTFETGVSSSHYFFFDNVNIFSPANEPVYSLTPTVKAFGSVDVGDFREQLFTIQNDGAVAFTLTNIQVSDTDNFSLVDVPDPLPTLAYGQTATFKVRYAPIAGGTHTATLTITDDISSRVTHVYADSLTGTGVALVVLPYFENFDSRDVTISPANTWVVGTPAKTQINHAYSTPNAIVTRSLTANANVSENSYVTLPTMSLSGITNGVFVGFYQNYYHEADYDGGELQYSKDFGNTWYKVNPTIGTGANFSNTLSYNWYNNASASGPITAPKWSGRSNANPGHIDGWIPTYTWITADSLGAATSLKLRYHFGTDGVTSYEGWALDDISVAAMPEQEFAIANLNITPVEYVTTNDTLSIKVNVANLGFGTDGTDLSLKINDTVVDVISTGTMQFNETQEFEFNFTFSAGGTYTISVVLDDDAYTFNNTVSMSDFIVFNAGWLAEGFEVGFLPSRWVKWGVPYWEHSLDNAYDGTKAAKVTLAADSPGSYLATPRLTLATGDSLFFWAKSSVAGMQLQLRHNSNADTTATWTAIGDTITLSTSYARYAVDLSSLDGEFERFAFEALPNGNAGTIYLDRVLGPEIYIPTAPPGLVVMSSPADRIIDVNPKTVVLDWDVPTSGGDPESYLVYIGLFSDPEILIDSYENYAEVFHPTTQYKPYDAVPSFTMEYGTDYYWMVLPINQNGAPETADLVVYKLTTQPAPLSGTWTIDPNGSGTTNFTNFTDAVNYLNAYGVETGGVTINVAYATYSEAIPAITYNATGDNPVYFVGIDGENGRTLEPPSIMGTTGTGTTDAILKLNGCDWISFDNFIIKENPANTDGTTRFEFGVLVTNNGAADGAKNNTISNCDVQLVNTYNLVRGVKQIATGVTTAAGANSYNRYYNNVVTSYWGYELVGSTTLAAFDMGTEIGSATEGNGSIVNCTQGVNYSNQTGLKIFQQNIIFIGGAAPAIQYGINSLAGANTVEIYNNDISHASQMTASYNVYGINITNNAAASVHDNNIHNLSTTYNLGYIYGIYVSQGGAKQENAIYNNNIYDITQAYYFYGIYVTAAASNLVNNIYNNEVYNIFRAGTASLYTYAFYIGSSTSTNNNNVYDNTVRDISLTATSYIYGYYLTYGAGQFYQNEVDNITAGTTFYGIYSNYTNATPWYIRNNMVQNITTATFYGIYANYGSNPRHIYENEVYNITASSTSYGAYLYYGTGPNHFYKNTIHAISGAGTVYGVYAYYTTTNNVYKNKIYDLTYTGTSTSVVYGIYAYASSSSPATVNVYNNFIYDLKAPTGSADATAPQIIGIYTSTAYALNIWNNTVYLNATSSNANFASAALHMASGGGTAGLLDLKNNIFVNKSTPGATGRAVAFWKGSTVFTNMSATTNKNIYYAGVPSATRPIYYDGTNTKITFDDYKAFIATKDQLSSTEDVPFVGGSRTIDLHIDPTISTYVEGNAIVIATVVDDIDDDVRNATTPDIGADEGDFTPLPDVSTPLAQATNLVIVPTSTTLDGTFTASDATNYLVVRHTTATLGATPIELKKYAVNDTLGANGTVVGNVSTGVFSATGLTVNTQYYFTIFANNMNAVYGPKYLLTDPLTGTQTTLPTAPANPSTFTAAAYNYQQINFTAAPNAGSDPIMVAWNTTNVFGNPISNVAYSNGTSITGGGTVWYVGAAGSLPNHTGLNELTTYYYKAWSYLTSGEYKVYSAGMTSNATTPMAPITPPYVQGFEGTFPPAGWSRWTGLLDNPSVITSTTSYWGQDDWCNISSNPDDAARLNIYGTSCKHWIISPQFNLATTDHKLKFDLCLTDFANYAAPDPTVEDRFVVLVGDGTSWTPTNIIREWNNSGSAYVYDNIPYTGTSVMIPLTGISGPVYFAFYGESTVSGGDNDLMINNVQVFSGEWDDYAISNLTITPLYKFEDVPTTINFRVTNLGEVTTGKIAYLKIGDTVVDNVAVGTLNTGAYADLSFNYTFTDAGTYNVTVYVPADQITTNDTATLSSQVIYYTDQLAEGFESTFPPSRWLNWSEAEQNLWTQGTTPNDGGTKNGQLVIANSAHTGAHLATPLLNILAGDTFKFWARATSANRQIQMKYSAGSTTDPLDWTNLGSPISLTTTYTEYTVDISSLASARGVYRLAFNGLPNGSTGTIYIDKVVGPKKDIPLAAPGPVTLASPADAATGINPKTVVFDWDEPLSGGNAESYTVYASTDSLDIDGQYTFTVNAPVTELNPYTYSTPVLLDYNTKWYWTVRPTNTYGSTDLVDCPIYDLTTIKQLQVATTLDLGTVFPSLNKTGSIVVTNIGDDELTFSAASDDFTFGARFSIPADSTYSLPYTFLTPATEGAYTGTITLTETNPGASVTEIDVTGSISRTIQAGTDVVDLELPMNPYYGYSYSQSIYKAEELSNLNKQITKLYYYWVPTTGYPTTAPAESDDLWDIWMGHTTDNEFAATSPTFMPLSGLTKVYAGSVPLTATEGWVEIVLTTPFLYNGTQNLVIAVDENEAGYDDSTSRFNCSGTTERRSMLVYADSYNPDPTNPPTEQGSYSFYGTKLGYPNIKVFMADPPPPTLAINPVDWNYGEVEQYSSTPKQFTVTNIGIGSFDVSSVYVEGGNASEFTVSALNLPVSVTGVAPYNFTVTLAPTTTGAKTTTLKVVDSLSRTVNEYTLTATVREEFVGVPINLQATVSNYNNVALSWGVTSTPWLTWGGTTQASSFRATDFTPFDTASKFTTTDLAGYAGYTINRIKFYAANEDSSTFRIRIWKGTDGSVAPSTMEVDQAVATYTQGAWNEVILDTPFAITGTDALWIGYNVTYTPSAYSAAVSAGPTVADKGLLHNINGEWVVPSTLNYNLMVQAYTAYGTGAREATAPTLSIPVVSRVIANGRVTAETDPNAPLVDATRALQGYNVYRNNVQLNTTLLTETTYNDLGVANGSYDYTVKAVYMSGSSNPSNTASVVINRPAAHSLPFTEDWSSNSLNTNYWTKLGNNWVVGTPGNPAPALKFNYNPIASNYNYYLTSWDIDALAYNDVNLKYDIRLDTNTTETIERLAVEVYDGNAWQEVDTFNNQAGDFAWDSKVINISSHVGNSLFKVRFRAYGSDSSTLNYWAIDNIMVEGISAVDAPVVTISVNEDSEIELNWDAVAGASSYKVYGSSSPDDSSFPTGWTELTTTNITATTFVFDPSADKGLFFKVTAVSGARGNETVIPMASPARSRVIKRVNK